MIQAVEYPETVSEAVMLKESSDIPCLFLGGGTEINTSGFLTAPTRLISLANLDLIGIHQANGILYIKGATTIQSIMDFVEIPEVIHEACLNFTNRNVRNIATIGGHIANNKPCADLIPALIALDAQLVVVSSKGTRQIPIIDYINSESNVLITEVRIKLDTNRYAAILRHAQSSNSGSVIIVAVSHAPITDGKVNNPIIAIGGVAAHAVRLTELENRINGHTLPELTELEMAVSDAISPVDDIKGSSVYKKHIAGVLAGRLFYGKKIAEVS